MTAANTTRRQIAYTYDDVGNLTSENRSGVDIGKKDELVRYYYDGANQLVKTTVEGVTTQYTYDLAGNLLSDGAHTYTYDLQNRLLTKAGADGTTTYTYDAAGNLIKEVSPDGSVSYTYNAQNRLVKGETSDGQSSAYTYNALGARITNVQVRENQNAGHQNGELLDGSHGVNYLDFLKDGRFDWQRVFESQVGTTHQNDFETVTKHYTVDYLSIANRDIMVTEDGSWTARYVYEENGTRISAEFGYAEGTHPGEGGENLQSDFAATDIRKVWYRTSHLGSTLFAVNADGEVISHTVYDPWGNPLTETYTDANFSGLDNANNFTGYTWDEVLGLYFAQNRFYDAADHRFTQEDIAKDGGNWYVYCGNGPTVFIDYYGLFRNGDLLYRGAENNKADVKALQKRLNDFAPILGYDQLDVNGQFDLATERAVNKYKDTYLPGGNMGANRGKVGYTTWTNLGLPVKRPNTLTGIVPELLFSWDSSQGIWYSPLYVAQRPFGYNTVYDGVFTLANDVSVEIDRDRPAVDYLYFKSEFTYSGKEWKIEGWKGQYLNMGIGAEIGIYYYNKVICDSKNMQTNWMINVEYTELDSSGGTCYQTCAAKIKNGDAGNYSYFADYIIGVGGTQAASESEWLSKLVNLTKDYSPTELHMLTEMDRAPKESMRKREYDI